MKIRHSSHALPRDEGHPSSDAVAVTEWGEGFLTALADGAGTDPAARDAAKKAVSMVSAHYRTHPLVWTPGKALRETVRLINRTLWNESHARFDRPEMVCTLVVALYDQGFLTCLGIGDSRIYLLRDGVITQLTTDDIEPGAPLRLTRALGAVETLNPTTTKLNLQEGDSLLLCSDGIHHHLNDAEISAAIMSHGSARLLAKQANEESPDESRDDCAAIHLVVDSLGWTARREDQQLPIPDQLATGQKHDGWTLTRSFGANDRCWLAEREGCRQVMKFAPREGNDDLQIKQAFLKETWNAIRFAADTPFVKAWENPTRTSLYYIMEFVDAPGLESLLRQRRLQVDEAVQLGRFLAESSILLLRQDLVHGDIKPENILIGSAYDSVFFKLIDLGSSCEIFSRTSRAGTATYLAPERFSNAPVTERTEVFSIGVTLYQALTGQLPFGAIERFQTPAFREPKPPSSLNPMIPPWLDAVILRACSIRAERRHQHFSELAFELANPGKVRPWHAADTALFHRHPVLFWKVSAILLVALSLFLAYQLLSS
ncbi:protein phosphatase 2C domain-containing protein [Luteolibacter sp. SL250]|uniref:bifunctional protein-serine/threonine kinase/phosphatase n=1 Tax=Luteolibacter sp. SL250 TaxID=2995170 RepID=UPI00226D4F3A|nr:bifunctional protein-serine/threonine kinase/phosphatase [Luteolibacter sp. SL250]WAC18257.1 protein phosphatase 2C domain-containing protein [Luteolibacter sp. SL250]